MINNYDGKKVTPRQLAEDYLVTEITGISDNWEHFLSKVGLFEDLSDTEREAVATQIKKLTNKFRKICRYLPIED